MGRVLLWLAATGSLAMTGLHVLAGGALAIPPLMSAESLDAETRWLLYFTWHDGTAALIVCSAALAYAAARAGNRAIAVFAGLVLAGFGVAGLGVAVVSGALWATPAPYAFGILALLALTGAGADKRPG